MADKKISELPAASALAGSEPIAAVQSGDTKKTTPDAIAARTSTVLGFGTTDSIIIPVGTTAQRAGSPVAGMARLNSSLGIMEYYDGTVWRGFGEQFIELGTPVGGGYFAGYISTTADGVPTHYLIVAPKATGQSATSLAYRGTSGQTDPSDTIDGPTNTATLVATNDAPAAQFCANLSIGGFTDWYLPALSELEVLYWSLKPTTETNTTLNTSRLRNDYAVPKITTDVAPAGPPVQTIANQFRVGNSEAFDANYYWCSTQLNTTIAWRQTFANGNIPTDSTKPNLNLVRAVRRMAI
jgi:hypothetical protein